MPEEEQDPFDPYVQELQGQEEAIELKIEIIKEIAKDVGLTDLAKEILQDVPDRFADLQELILEKKAEDLDQEMKDLGELIEHPENFTPPPPQPPVGPQPPWWPPFWPWPPVWPPAGGGSSSSSSSSSGAVSGDDQTPPNAATVTLGVQDRDFIVARSKTKVWVWHPLDLKWVAELDAEGDIVEMAQVDGSVAVRTADALWLFDPLHYRWMGPLQAPVEEVTSYTLAVPAPVQKE